MSYRPLLSKNRKKVNKRNCAEADMTQVDWFPILTKICGPQCIELSIPPEKIVFCMGALSHNVPAEETTIGPTVPFKMRFAYSSTNLLGDEQWVF